MTEVESNFALYEKIVVHDKKLRNHINKYIPHHILVDDLMQDFYEKILSKEDTLKENSNYLNWGFTVLINLLITQTKTKYNKNILLIQDEDLGDYLSSEEQVEVCYNEPFEKLFYLVKDNDEYVAKISFEDMKNYFEQNFDECFLVIYNTLSDLHKNIIIYRHIGHYGYVEIAKKLKIEIPTVKNVLHKFKKMLINNDCK